MFETLASSLQNIFRNLRGYGRLSESNIREAMRQVRLALLEADVNYAVARDLVDRVTTQCLGREVLESLTPGQQVIKHVHDELVRLLDGGHQRTLLPDSRPAAVLLIGLHGSGKTTTAAKLARLWKKEGRSVLLVAADIRRPAAVEQLGVLAREVGVELLAPAPGETVPELGRRALDAARETGRDIALFDTGGRRQLDQELLAELRSLREAVACRHTLLVVDAAIGQESVHVATGFHQALGLQGLILTKLDGDARGGAALSIQAVTGCPILYVANGERLEDLTVFHPDRMASRILGMGDVVSLVEKAQAAMEARRASELEQRLRRDQLTLEDFLEQLGQWRRMGSAENLLELLPLGNLAPGRRGAAAPDPAEFAAYAKRAEAILRSMTPAERQHPELLNASRRRRIARGSGTQVQDVNELLRQFEQTRRLLRTMRKLGKRRPW